MLTALFILLTDACRVRPDKVTLTLAVASAAPALLITPVSMVPDAMSVFTASLAVRHRLHPGPRHG